MPLPRSRHWGAAALLLSCAFGQAGGQTVRVGDPLEDYLRVLQISGRVQLGSFTVRPLGLDHTERIAAEGPHPWAAYLDSSQTEATGTLRIGLTDSQLRAFANSRFPVGRNDGVVWQGRGLTTALDVGATLHWRAFSIEVRPTLLFTQNSSHDLAPVTVQGMPIYAYPWREIDWPQRFGPDPFWALDPGQSEIRVDARGMSLGFGSKNLWWGPGIRNAIILSNNAPGFPHGFLATDGPLGIGVGSVEARWIWGRLRQSDWFGAVGDNDERFITGIVVSYSPDFLTGLSLGLTRVFYVLVPDGGAPLSDYLAVLQGVRKKGLVTLENPTGDDEHDQLASLFGRWVLPESGFEVYWEWARTDHAWELRDFLLEPEYSQAYTLGLQKAILMRGDRTLTLQAELTHLERNATAFVRGGNPVYYAHHIVTQGYTQRGQIIGAGIGPGGNSQYLGADLYAPWGRAGVYLERQVHDNDAYHEWAEANNETFCCHDVSFHLGTHALFFVDDFDLGAGMIITREYNRYFYGLDLWNLNLSLSARWRPH